jgi:hypothetical protein
MDSYILRRTSLGALDPTLMNPFFNKNLRISSMGVCFSKYELVVTRFRMVLFGKRTPTFGLYLSLPTWYVLLKNFLLCLSTGMTFDFCFVFSFNKISDGLLMRSEMDGRRGRVVMSANGLVTDGPIADGLVTDGPIADGLVTDGPVTSANGLVANGPVTSAN